MQRMQRMQHMQHMKHMRRIDIVILVVVAILVAAHVRNHLTPCKGVQIVQAPLSRCTPELFAEKRPVVITDRVVDHRDLPRTVFKCQHLWTGRPRQVVENAGNAGNAGNDGIAGKAHRSMARFTLLFSTTPTSIDIAHPRHPSDIVRIVLDAGRTLVLPPLWYYTVSSSTLFRIALI
jgi:hypothetical protein